MSKLMAPGGTMQMAYSVLEEGADAVYVGVLGWSRRGSDVELKDEEIKDLVAFAETKGKEVRVVLNTMPSSMEVPLLLKKVDRYIGWGVSGFMISDVGCMVQVRKHFPEIAIHVSVGTGLTNAEDVKYYKDMGATYVILPYRMWLDDVKAIKRTIDVGLEIFLFRTDTQGGIICPGKCTMSSYFRFKRWVDDEGKDYFYGSANRGGDCLRICQIGWEVATDGQPLSKRAILKGNPRLWFHELTDYIKAGVEYFKVPGRDRSDVLVRDIVRFYRKVVDEIRASQDRFSPEKYLPELEELKKRWATERNRRDDRLVARAKA
ncbi:MAG: U32 family peptidase [candidate division NC10 bacterium]|nr:U32 family peptidase [candidate division NC10 bacterium]